MKVNRRAYPSDVTDEEWALGLPYLRLLREDAGQRQHPLRELFNALRCVLRTGCTWRYLPPVDTLGHLLAAVITQPMSRAAPKSVALRKKGKLVQASRLRWPRPTRATPGISQRRRLPSKAFTYPGY